VSLPFTRAQFFDVFADYNAAVWPMQIALNGLAIVLVALVLVSPRHAGRAASLGLALLWCWLAMTYHLTFFWRINPAAPAFAALSLVAAGAFAWAGARARLRFRRGLRIRAVGGLALIVFALLVYPALDAWFGHRYPATPTFGLPCPTTLYTFGMLLLAADPPKAVVVAPLLWAVIGSTAAFALGVTEDLALVLAAAPGVYMLATRVRRDDSMPAQAR
jgi:Family of unknown function (DUF6064)